uniref:RT_RNaseH_2 domain-containing protein n=1 Tax=Anopheles stephensi TaxID=30069 RepID=A0A182YHE4_ANOST
MNVNASRNIVCSNIAFDTTCVQALETLRDKLINSPVLAIFDLKPETELHCDASSSGFGAILLQKQDDNKLHPVNYFSKTTSKDESKLHSYELETLSIIYALKRFHTYVHGLPIR